MARTLTGYERARRAAIIARSRRRRRARLGLIARRHQTHHMGRRWSG